MRPSHPRRTGGFAGISFGPRQAKHQENLGPFGRVVTSLRLDSIAVLMMLTLPETLTSHKGPKPKIEQNVSTWPRFA
jgi:hypothetical protein